MLLTRAWSGGAGLSATALAAMASWSTFVSQTGAVGSGGGGGSAHRWPGDPAIGRA